MTTESFARFQLTGLSCWSGWSSVAWCLCPACWSSAAPPQYAVKWCHRVFALLLQLSEPPPESPTPALRERRGKKAVPFRAILSRFQQGHFSNKMSPPLSGSRLVLSLSLKLPPALLPSLLLLPATAYN